MTTAEDLVLITTDPASGKTSIDSMKADAVLGGAIVLDLAAAGRLAVEGEGRKARLHAVDRSPVGDAVLDAALRRAKDSSPPRSAVTRLGKHGLKGTLAALVERGVLRDRHESVLGFGLRRHDVVQRTERAELLQAVRAVLLQDREPDERTGRLVGLLSSGDLVNLVVAKHERKQAKRRAKAVAEGDWASKAVKDAIAASQAAMMAAMAGGAAAAGSAGS